MIGYLPPNLPHLLNTTAKQPVHRNKESIAYNYRTLPSSGSFHHHIHTCHCVGEISRRSALLLLWKAHITESLLWSKSSHFGGKNSELSYLLQAWAWNIYSRCLLNYLATSPPHSSLCFIRGRVYCSSMVDQLFFNRTEASLVTSACPPLWVPKMTLVLFPLPFHTALEYGPFKSKQDKQGQPY